MEPRLALKSRRSMDTISTVGTKRDLESDDEDPDGDIPSKRQHIKKTEGQSTTELATITQADPNLRGQPVQGAEESSIMYVEEPWQDSLDFPLESSQRNVPDGGDRGQDIMKYLEVPPIIRTLGLTISRIWSPRCHLLAINLKTIIRE